MCRDLLQNIHVCLLEDDSEICLSVFWLKQFSVKVMVMLRPKRRSAPVQMTVISPPHSAANRCLASQVWAGLMDSISFSVSFMHFSHTIFCGGKDAKQVSNSHLQPWEVVSDGIHRNLKHRYGCPDQPIQSFGVPGLEFPSLLLICEKGKTLILL